MSKPRLQVVAHVCTCKLTQRVGLDRDESEDKGVREKERGHAYETCANIR